MLFFIKDEERKNWYKTSTEIFKKKQLYLLKETGCICKFAVSNKRFLCWLEGVLLYNTTPS